jgi:hypothetical protein
MAALTDGSLPRRRRFPPWPTHSEFVDHLRDDQRVHSETTRSLSTILDEVRRGNQDTAALRAAFAPLEPISRDIVETIAARSFRHQLYALLIVCAKGLGWMAALIGTVAGVAAISPGFAAWLKWIL